MTPHVERESRMPNPSRTLPPQTISAATTSNTHQPHLPPQHDGPSAAPCKGSCDPGELDHSPWAVIMLLPGCRCRCGHEWLPRIDEKPTTCPKCKSPRWDWPTSSSGRRG